MTLNGEKIGIIYHPDYLLHSHVTHPERKERLEYINKALEDKIPMDKVEKIDPAPAEVDDIALVHDRPYIESIEEACRSGREFLDLDTYIVPESYRVALLSAGGALTGLRTVMENGEGRLKKCFTFNRPPGHHAEKNRAMGFCLFNNVAVAAAAAKRDYGLKRVAIVDWDVHHGNGTQHAFEDDPEVLVISTHQSPAYPGTGRVEDTGRGRGEGFNVNIPLPAGTGDTEYKLAFDSIITPILDQYKPELLLISAGQDAFHRDPLAGMSLSENGYYYMADQLSRAAERLSGGKMVLCLEGGYHLEGQAGVIVQVLNALGRWNLPMEEPIKERDPAGHIQRRLEQVIETQKTYWNL